MIEVDLTSTDPVTTSERVAELLNWEQWSDPKLLDTRRVYAAACGAPDCDYLVECASKQVAQEICTKANRVGRGGHEHVFEVVSRIIGEWKPVG